MCTFLGFEYTGTPSWSVLGNNNEAEEAVSMIRLLFQVGIGNLLLVFVHIGTLVHCTVILGILPFHDVLREV